MPGPPKAAATLPDPTHARLCYPCPIQTARRPHRSCSNVFSVVIPNPNAPEEEPLRSPEEILAEIEALDAESADLLAGIRKML